MADLQIEKKYFFFFFFDVMVPNIDMRISSIGSESSQSV